jgi:hypothetical protein
MKNSMSNNSLDLEFIENYLKNIDDTFNHDNKK